MVRIIDASAAWAFCKAQALLGEIHSILSPNRAQGSDPSCIMWDPVSKSGGSGFCFRNMDDILSL